MKDAIILTGRYTSAIIYAWTIEEGVYQQVYDIINNPAFRDKKVVLMPDVHVGASGPCGLVAEIGDWICPEHIGVDIGCSVTMAFLDKRIPIERMERLEHLVKNKIPMGFDIHDHTIIDYKDFYKFLTKEFAKAKSAWPEALSDLPTVVTEKWVSNQLKRIGMEEGKFYKSLGTVGGGNHFIEYGESVDSGGGAFTIHFGSRNFGNRVCKYWMKKTANPMTKAEAKKITAELRTQWKAEHNTMEGFEPFLKGEIQARRNDFIKGYLTGDDMKGYLCDMVFAQAYARYNHKTVLDIISNILEKNYFDSKIVDTVTCTHNYIDMEDHLIRKSSIAARLGEQVIVPLNMRDGTILGIGKGNHDWLNSCSHGAGRKMSRSKAKENITLEEFEKSMEGIVTSSVDENTIDESPMAYKDSNEIVEIIQDTIGIVEIFKPRISWKASEIKED